MLAPRRRHRSHRRHDRRRASRDSRHRQARRRADACRTWSGRPWPTRSWPPASTLGRRRGHPRARHQARGRACSSPRRSGFARVKTVDVAMPFKTETFSDSSLPRGTRQIIVAGSTGLKMQRLPKAIVDRRCRGPLDAHRREGRHPAGSAARGDRHRACRASPPAGARLIKAKRTRGSSKTPTGHRMRLESTAYSPNEPGGGGGPSTAMGHPARLRRGRCRPARHPARHAVYVPGLRLRDGRRHRRRHQG